MISVLLPVYNERGNLAPLLNEINVALGNVDLEIVAIDDCSHDGSIDELRNLRSQYPNLRVAKLNKHTGQSAAFLAGIDLAKGEVLVMMDADRQNDPADVPSLLRELDSDRTVTAVVGYRRDRKDTRWKRLQSRIANAIRNRLTRDRIRDTGCSLRVVRSDAAKRLPRFNGMHRFIPTLLRQQGGKVVEAPVSHRPRTEGKSKYGMWNRAFWALRDAFGVRWLNTRAIKHEVLREID